MSLELNLSETKPVMPLSLPSKQVESKGFFGRHAERKEERHKQKKFEKVLRKVNRKFEMFFEKQALYLNKVGYSRADAEEIIRKAISKQKLVEVLA